jgi:hypothetical protein
MKEQIVNLLIAVGTNENCTDDELENTWDDVINAFDNLLDKIDSYHQDDLKELLFKRYNTLDCNVCGCNEFLCGHNKRM